MPTTASSSAGSLMPISLSMAGHTVDMSVPPNIALAELVPAMVKAMGPLDAGTATQGFVIRTSDGRALNQSKSLPDQDVRAGAVLALEATGTNTQDQSYDDLVEAVGTTVAENSTPWEKTHSVQLSAHASAALVLVASLLLLTGSRATVLTGAVGLTGAILTTLAAAVVARMPNRPGALSLGHTTPVLVACAAFAFAEGPWFAMPLLSAGIGLLVGSSALLVLPADLRVSIAGPITTGLSFLLVGSLIQAANVPPPAAASLTFAILIVLTLSAPWVAIAQLPVTVSSGEDEHIDPAKVSSNVTNSRVLVIALKAGCSVAMVVLSPLLATTPTSVAVLTCVGLALMLSTRSLRSRVEVLLGVLTGMFLTVIAAVATTAVFPNALPWTLGATILAAVVLLAANVVSQKLRPWLTRFADALGIIALLAIPPLTALVWGVF
ncbi:MAG: EsaB/YukD family protein [Propionibacteriaceae bacterium]|nr:EsaB/YukD family protein [Propionibacteriaceae bacterium]